MMFRNDLKLSLMTLIPFSKFYPESFSKSTLWTGSSDSESEVENDDDDLYEMFQQEISEVSQDPS